MNVLEKVLEEIEDNAIEFESFGMCDDYVSVGWVKEIMRSHMNHNSDDTEMDGWGWIPVSERLPESYKLVEVTVHCSEWISDYDSVWVSENEKIHHDEEYLVGIGCIDKDGDWIFYDQDGCEFYCDKELGSDKSNLYIVATAWQPLPEPYKGD